MPSGEMEMKKANLVCLVSILVVGAWSSVFGQAKPPLTRAEVIEALNGGVSPKRVVQLVNEFGIQFEPTEENVQPLRQAGADDELIAALRAKSFETHMQRGNRLQSSAMLDEAERQFALAVQYFPKDLNAHLALARVYDSEKKYEQAIEQYRTALQLNPEKSELQLSLAQALLGKGDATAALQACQAAADVAPDNIEARLCLAKAQHAKGDKEASIAEFKKAVRLGGSAQVHALAQAVVNSGDPGAALEPCRALVEADANDGPAHFCLGKALLAKGDKSAALAELNQARTLLSRSNPGDALEVCRVLATAKPDDAEAHVCLAKALRAKGDSPNATAEFEKASMLGSAEAAAELPWWIDPATGLRWTRQDNGSKVDWNQARNYCTSLRLGGYSNWRLPTIDELVAIYDHTGHHFKGGIKVFGNGYIWSGTAKSSRDVWGFDFNVGKRASCPSFMAYTSDDRVLCVRGSGE
jgi:tetratricopeptide (TPR) repeat protein